MNRKSAWLSVMRIWVDENLQPLGQSNWEMLGFDEARQHEFITGDSLESLLKGAFVWGCMMAFRASYKTLILPIPENLSGIIHDSWAAILIAAVAPIRPIPQRLVEYRQHSKQQLGQKADQPINFVRSVSQKYNYGDEINRLKSIRDRLAATTSEFPSDAAQRQINSRLHHFERRETIRRGSAKKFALVIQELLSRRYHRHTSGFKSAIKDLFTA